MNDNLVKSKRGQKFKIEATPHPKWVERFLDFIAPYNETIVNSRLCSDMAAGTLSMKRFRGALLNFYPLIESFPQFMELVLAKIPPGSEGREIMARQWLVHNINIERNHADWYRQWALDFGVPQKDLSKSVDRPAEMDSANNDLWKYLREIATHGSVAEGIAAINYGIERPCGEWCRRIRRPIHTYENRPGVTIRKGTTMWVNVHARYDDAHPDEALELIKLFAITKKEQNRVRFAAKRTMEYYAIAADACYEMFD